MDAQVKLPLLAGDVYREQQLARQAVNLLWARVPEGRHDRGHRHVHVL
jgi:hypothetical protein